MLNFYVTRCWEEQKQYKHVDKHLRGASGSDKHPLHRCFYSDLEVSADSLKLNLVPFYFAVFPETVALAVSVPLCFFVFFFNVHTPWWFFVLFLTQGHVAVQSSLGSGL